MAIIYLTRKKCRCISLVVQILLSFVRVVCFGLIASDCVVVVDAFTWILSLFDFLQTVLMFVTE